MKTHATVMGVATLLLCACAGTRNGTEDTLACAPQSNVPPPSDAVVAASGCPPSTYYLSVLFDANDNPVGVGGGVAAGTGDPDDKKVSKNDKICWIGIRDANTAANVDLDILFSPKDSPNPNLPHEFMQIAPNAPSGVHYKYTVWRTGSGAACTFLDPRIVIN